METGAGGLVRAFTRDHESLPVFEGSSESEFEGHLGT